MRFRTPKTIEDATALLERHAVAEGVLAAIEANRAQALAATNAVADSLATPAIEEMTALQTALEPWWAGAAALLTGGKRKSIELGGCAIGTRAGSTSLSVPDDEGATIADMRTLRWAKDYLKSKVSIDRPAVKRGLDGKHKPGLTQLGFSITRPAPTFFVERLSAGAAETIAR